MIAFAVLSAWVWFVVILTFGMVALTSDWVLKRFRSEWTMRRRIIMSASLGPILCLVAGGVIAILGLTSNNDDWGPLVAVVVAQLAIAFAVLGFVLGLLTVWLLEKAGQRR